MKTKLLPSLLLAGIVTTGLAGCSTTSTDAANTAAPTWSYDGDDGPASWGDVSATCQNTSASTQSPIDIDTANLGTSNSATPVTLHYTPTSFKLENNGHTIEAVPTDLKADFVTIGSTNYYLQQFHFHAESEHELNGAHTAMELHLVHKSADGKLVVLGVMIQPGTASSALDELFSIAPPSITPEDDLVKLTKKIDPSALIPTAAPSAQYNGSLTTPPCTEGVLWNVYLTPITISPEQLHKFTDIYPNNHRPDQPLHNRQVMGIPAS